jgi:hypothetical protein
VKIGILLAAAGAVAIVGAPAAAADDAETTVTSIGGQAELVNGDVVQAWTVLELQPSLDFIPYQPQGTLWEAIVTDEAIRGSVTPIVADFNARAESGENYRALFQVPTAQGISPATLSQGQEVGGKIYFDVTGTDPSSVVYNSMGQDLIVWQQPTEQTTLEELEVDVDGDTVVITDEELIVDGDQAVLEETEIVIEGDNVVGEQSELEIAGY